MANLIIKSSADNLVLQGSDASPAITVGATGTTTFAENATLSGTANALGTVTSGNLSNTAIVYPDGFVLQVQGSSDAAAVSSVTSSGTQISQAITLVDYANNDVLIVCTGYIVKDGGGDSGHAAFHVNGGSLGSGTSGPRFTQQALYQQANSHEETVSISYWDKAPPQASNTYGIHMNLNESMNVTKRFTLMVYEINR